MAEFETIDLQFDTPRDMCATITFNRPKALNALNSKVGQELKKAISEIEHRITDLRALILTGAGDRSFIAGADISEMVKLNPSEARNFLYTLQGELKRLEDLPIPVIAKINGFALGGGLEVALACDIRISSENAVVGLPEVSLGLIPSAGGTQRLSRIVGEGVAKYLIMTGKRLKAIDALKYGIVTEVVPLEELDQATNKLLDTLFKLAPIAIGAAKHSIQVALDESINSGMEIELDEAVKCFQTSDLREGMNAFLEKRPANFKNK